MERKQFTFYRSFYDTIQCISAKSQRLEAFEAICEYALGGIEPDLQSLKPKVRMVMQMCMPILSAANKKAELGRKGGLANRSTKIPMGTTGELGEEEKAAIRRMLAG